MVGSSTTIALHAAKAGEPAISRNRFYPCCTVIKAVFLHFPCHCLFRAVGGLAITTDAVVAGLRCIIGNSRRTGGLNNVVPVAVLFGYHIRLGGAGLPFLAFYLGGNAGAIAKRYDYLGTGGEGLGNHKERVTVFKDNVIYGFAGGYADVVELVVLCGALVAPCLGLYIVAALAVNTLELYALDGLGPRKVRAHAETDGGQGVVERERNNV